MANQLVILDPGHGGKDPGSVGPGGVKESDINFMVACKVGAILDSKGIRWALTHNGKALSTKSTEDINMRIKTILEMTPKPAAVISIHCNGFNDPAANGTESLYYSNDKLAGILQVELIKYLNRTNRGIKQQNVGVIREAEKAGIPAALVELGFITNTAECKFLWSAAGQNKAALAISEGIIKYLGIPAAGAGTEWDRIRTEARAWAKENKISDGSRPGDPVTREELWSMMLNYSKNIKGVI